MARPTVKDADFVGRAAYEKQRSGDPAAILCTLTVDDHTSKNGEKRYIGNGSRADVITTFARARKGTRG